LPVAAAEVLQAGLFDIAPVGLKERAQGVCHIDLIECGRL
jgi:hypothetical protein